MHISPFPRRLQRLLKELEPLAERPDDVREFLESLQSDSCPLATENRYPFLCGIAAARQMFLYSSEKLKIEEEEDKYRAERRRVEGLKEEIRESPVVMKADIKILYKDSPMDRFYREHMGQSRTTSWAFRDRLGQTRERIQEKKRKKGGRPKEFHRDLFLFVGIEYLREVGFTLVNALKFMEKPLRVFWGHSPAFGEDEGSLLTAYKRARRKFLRPFTRNKPKRRRRRLKKPLT